MTSAGGRTIGHAPVVAVCAALAAFGCASVLAAESSASTVRILYFEPFRVTWSAPAEGVRSKPGDLKAAFDAHGQRFELTLEPNELLITAPRESGSSLRLYRGSLAGNADSWVRFAVRGSAVNGMIWDGREILIVEPTELLRDALPAQAGDASDNVIFRLGDALLEPGTATCAVAATRGATRGTAVYEALRDELRGIRAQATGAMLRLQVSVIADALMRERFSSDAQTRDEIFIRLNNVDGIYSSQIGVEIQVPTVDIRDASADPFTATTAAASLLDELGQLRRNSPQLRSAGLTHLFTGRNLDGTTVGIAFLDSLCSQQFGAALTESRDRSSFIDSLIAAHEIGHNFGAVHDGEGSCPATPGFLMAPSVGPSNTAFSQCSLDIVVPRSRSASCVTGLTPADVSVTSNLGTLRHPVGRPFELEINVVNVGGAEAQSISADVLVPPTLVVEDAFVPGGTCTSGGGVVACLLGNLQAGGTRAIHLALRGDLPGTNSVSVQIQASNDVATLNNQGQGTILIDPEADLGVSLTGPATAPAGQPANISFSITNRAVTNATGVILTLEIPNGATASAALDGGTCTSTAGVVDCRLPVLAASATASGTLNLTSQTARMLTLRARVSGSYFDPTAANDLAEWTIDITPVSSGVRSGGGGGGGAISPWVLLGIATLTGLRRRVQRPVVTRQALARRRSRTMPS